MVWYVFGEHELDTEGFVLRRGDVELPLQPKVFDVLRYLVEQRGRLVTKSELLDQLWPNEDVNEAVVTWSISHIRRAFGQERAAKTPIETVHGRGYRFTANASEQPAPRRAVRSEPRGPAFIGRERVLAELTQHLHDAMLGHGSLCALTGEAGIGKTRCTEELVKRASALGLRTLLARSPDIAGTPSLWPLGSALRAIRDEAAERACRTIAQLPEHDSPGQRFAAIELVGQAVQTLALAQPTLLVLDDLHWADTGTLEWVAFIAPELAHSPLCVVVALRDGEIKPSDPRARILMQVQRHARTLPLSSFDSAQVAELIASTSEQRPSAELSEAVRQASGGVPLFVLEVVRTLVRDHGDAELERLHPEDVRVPELARDILSQRIAQLPAETVELVQKAAVIGESFDLTLLASLVELEPEVLLERIAPAIREGQVTSDVPHAYRFAHALFQSVAYDGVPPRERAAIHRKVGELLSASSNRHVSATEIARHYYLSLPAGGHDDVVRIVRRAGASAMRRLAFEEAALCFGWALEAQLFTGAPSPQDRVELLLQLTGAQRSAGRTAAAMETAARAIELSLMHGLDGFVVGATRTRRPTVAFALTPDDLARAALEKVLARTPDGPSPTRIGALAQLAFIPPYEPDLATSKRLSAQAVALAEQQSEWEPMFEALRARWFAMSGPDDVQEALAVADRMLTLDASGQRSWQVMDARITKVRTLLLTGDLARADAALAEATAVVGSQWGEAAFYCRRQRAQRIMLDGRFEEGDALWQAAYKHAVRAGVSYAERLRAVQQLHLVVDREGARAAMEHHVPAVLATTDITRAMRADVARVAAEAGALDVVRIQLAAVGDINEYPRSASYVHGAACVAVAAIALGDRPLCERLIKVLAPYQDLNTPDVLGFYIGSVAYYLGLLAAALDREADARRYFERALTRNREMGHIPGVVRTLLASGRLEAKAGQAEVARAHFEAARSEAQAIGMRGAEAEARAGLK